MANEQTIKDGVAKWVIWWLEERKRKLREHLSDSMAVNPLLLPILFDFHNITKLEQLSDLIIGSHLMIGHSTGFGKLLDEKVLPNVFGTIKLDAHFRKTNKPFGQSCFNEIDHLVAKGQGVADLLSLKASRWTIQLTMAKQLNNAFDEILTKFPKMFREIVVGVQYGKREELTDKYDILRGINRGARHDVKDLTARVKVYAGREFWAWLNGGEARTQDWLLAGIKLGLEKDNSRAECGRLLDAYRAGIVKSYSSYVRKDGSIDWERLLTEISG